ncbi:MAG: alpha/beta hydrolase [Myxococcales bacterium]|nr:alpha/beta hydrolase [Myxococcales bacterium]
MPVSKSHFTFGTYELRALLPASRLVMLEGGGHFPQEDAPDAVIRELNAFLTAVP